MNAWLGRAQPIGRFTLAVVGLQLVVVCQLLRWWNGVPPDASRYWRFTAAEEQVLGSLMLAALVAGVCAGVAPPVARRLLDPQGWWARRGWALALSCALYGLGVASLGTFCLEYGARRMSPFLVFLLPLLGTLVLATCERGRRPLAGIALALLAGLAYTTLRLNRAPYLRLGLWDVEEILSLTLTYAFLLPVGYLVVQGMIVLVGGRAGGPATPARPPALELVRVAERYLLRLEVPGLGDVSRVQVALTEGAAELTVELPSPPTQGLLFSSRRVGALRVRAPLPVALSQGGLALRDGLLELELLPAAPPA